jgi:hypothetical protein
LWTSHLHHPSHAWHLYLSRSFLLGSLGLSCMLMLQG